MARKRIPIEEIRRRFAEDRVSLSATQRRSYALILAGQCVECTAPLEEQRLKEGHRRCDGCAAYHSMRVTQYKNDKKERGEANV